MRSIFLYSLICTIAVVLGVSIFTVYRGYLVYGNEVQDIQEMRRSGMPGFWKPGDPRGKLARQAYLNGDPPKFPTSILEAGDIGEYWTPPSTKYIGTATKPPYTVITDPLGFRVGSPRQAPTKINLLAIGGSQIWGQGLEFEDTVAAIVAKRMGYVLGNAGVPGYGGVETLRRMQHYLRLSPDVILYGLFEDHIYRNLDPTRGMRPVLALYDGGGAYHIRQGGLKSFGDQFVPGFLQGIGGDFLNAYFYQLKRDVVVALAGQSVDVALVDRFNLGGRPPQRDSKLVPLLVGGMSFLLSKMNTHAREIGAKFIVVYFPTLRSPHEIFHAPEAWKNLARDEGFMFVDITPFILPYIERSAVPDIAVSDGHYNAKVNAYMAGRVVELLKK